MSLPPPTPAYEAAVFYVMSGTGNSLRAARWAAEVASRSGLAARVTMLDAAHAGAHLGPGPRHLVGLFMPTHGFTAPWMAIKFALRLPRGGGAHAFCVATRASMKLGPWATPGMSGSATLVVACILAITGYRVRGLLGLDMPSNWLQVHPGFASESVAFIADKARLRITRFAETVAGGRRCFPALGLAYDLASGIATLPVSVAYVLYGRLVFAKMFFASDRCNGCGVCETSCPTAGVKLLGTDNPRPYWNYHCESCNRCVAYCPHRAIEIGHNWALVLTVASVVPLLPWLVADAPMWSRWFELLGNPVLGWAAVCAFWYVSLLLGYPLFYLATKVSLINRITTFTSPTRFWRRHRDPTITLKDLATNDGPAGPRSPRQKRVRKPTP